MTNPFKGVSAHGNLCLDGTLLVGQHGNPVGLRGMSSHGMQWYPQFARTRGIATTKRAGANVFRVAMYTAEGGYLTHPQIEKDVIAAVDDTLALDMYAMIDWHILFDNDPMMNLDKAQDFFNRMSKRYAGNPGVIYEICNEPNGDDVTWAGNVKPFAKAVVPVIQNNSPDAIIIVGSPTWSQDVDIAAQDPLKYRNIMYALHFYAGTHGADLRAKCQTALKLGAPIFVSEWGTSAADGDGGVFAKQSSEWLAFLNQHRLSWCNWNMGDRDETSAALKPGAPTGDWTDDDLTVSGQYVFERLNGSL